MNTPIDSYLSNYVHEVLIDLSMLRIKNDCAGTNISKSETIVDSDLFLTENLFLKWDEIHKIFGNLSDDFNILEQSKEWFKLMLGDVWEIINNVGEKLLNSTVEQRNKLWKSCENLNPLINLEICYDKLLRNSVYSQLQVLLQLTSSFERFLGNVYLSKGENVPFLLRDLLLTKELLGIFGRIPITFSQLLVGCPLGLNLRNVAWHGFLSSDEINTNLIATLFVLIASMNDIIKKLQLNVSVRTPVKLNIHYDLLKEVFPSLSLHRSGVSEVLNNSSVIPKTHRMFWKEAFNSYIDSRFGECLIVLLPLLEHLLRLVYCDVNSCSNRVTTAEATDLYTTLDEVLAPSSSDFHNHMIDFLGYNLTEMFEDIFCYPEGPRIRDKISHGEFDLFSSDNLQITEVFCNHIFSVGLSVMLIVYQKLKICVCNDCSSEFEGKESNDKKVQIKSHCHCNDIKNRLNFLEPSLSIYKSKFHPISYLLRSLSYGLNKLMLWNQLPRPQEYIYETDSLNDEILCLKHLIFKNWFDDKVLDFNEFGCNLKLYLDNINCLTLHRPRHEGILVTLMRHIVTDIIKLNNVIMEVSEIKYKHWVERKLRTRTRTVYQTMLRFLPSLQTILFCIIYIILYELKFINHSEPNWEQINRFLKRLLKFIENTISYCNSDRNQWQEVIKLTTEFTNSALSYLNGRFKSNFAPV